VIAEIAAANAAFQVIKTAIKNSGEIASAGKAVIDYFSATHAIEEEVKKTPERKRSDLEEFLALEQLRQQEQELKELFIYQGRPGLWDDWQAFKVKARQQREAEERQRIKAELDRKAKRKKTLENIMLTLWMIALVFCILTIAGFGLYLFLENR
jgi:vacuolar-type H+-ATPase subunit I/STV1